MQKKLRLFGGWVADKLQVARSEGRAPAYLFLTLAGLCGLIFVFVTPLLWGHDEGRHFGRAYGISRGELIAKSLGGITHDKGGFGTEMPINVAQLDVLQGADAGSYVKHQGYDQPVTTTTTLAKEGDTYNFIGKQGFSGITTRYAFPNTAPYSPVPYAPAVTALGVSKLASFDIRTTIYLMRLAGLIFFLACGTYALIVLRKTKLKWAFFVAAMIPMAVYQASVIGADALTMGVALVFTALVAKAWLGREALSRTQSVLLLLSGALLPLTKPTYGLLLALLLLVPASRLAFKHGKRIKLAVAAIAIVVFGAWTLLTAETSQATRLLMTPERAATIHPNEQVAKALSRPHDFAATIFRTVVQQGNKIADEYFGAFTTVEVRTPAIVVVLVVIAAVVAVAIGRIQPEKMINERKKWWLACGILLACIGLVFATLYATFTPVGAGVIDGVQGRYFLPYTPLLLLLAMTMPQGVGPAGVVVRVQGAGRVVAICSGLALLIACLVFAYQV